MLSLLVFIHFQTYAMRWHSCWIVSALLFFSSLEARPDHSGSGIDFSKAVDDPETGLQCVTNEATVETLEREKLLECVHKTVNSCHYTYVTKFRNQRVEECKDHYEKICNIAYHQVTVLLNLLMVVSIGLFWFSFMPFLYNGVYYLSKTLLERPSIMCRL